MVFQAEGNKPSYKDLMNRMCKGYDNMNQQLNENLGERLSEPQLRFKVSSS